MSLELPVILPLSSVKTTGNRSTLIFGSGETLLAGRIDQHMGVTDRTIPDVREQLATPGTRVPYPQIKPTT